MMKPAHISITVPKGKLEEALIFYKYTFKAKLYYTELGGGQCPVLEMGEGSFIVFENNTCLLPACVVKRSYVLSFQGEMLVSIAGRAVSNGAAFFDDGNMMDKYGNVWIITPTQAKIVGNCAYQDPPVPSMEAKVIDNCAFQDPPVPPTEAMIVGTYQDSLVPSTEAMIVGTCAYQDVSSHNHTNRMFVVTMMAAGVAAVIALLVGIVVHGV